ncbi:MAG TPA: hypothetical protein VKY44_01590 [Flavobacterium sp.]|nr:hypothetical protein [Flavobacterium sp.]
MFDITVDWKESLLILLGLVVIILLFYLFNRKSIAAEKQAEKLLKERWEQDRLIRHQAAASQPSARRATPQTLQAYERLIILMERMELPKLIARVTPISDLKQDYANFLIQNIDQEYDFNISQQLYVSEEAWALISTAKQTIIQQILKTSLNDKIKSAVDLQRELLKIKETHSVTDIAKNRLKQEFHQLV